MLRLVKHASKYHSYWLSSKQNPHVKTEDCNKDHWFEIKTDEGSGLATLPPSTYRDNESFRYSHVGRADVSFQTDELYNVFIELFRREGCLPVPFRVKNKTADEIEDEAKQILKMNKVI